MTSTNLLLPMRLTHWLILGVACGLSMLYFMISTWQDIAFVSSGEQLLRLGLMIGFAFVGDECFTFRSRRGSAPLG